MYENNQMGELAFFKRARKRLRRATKKFTRRLRPKNIVRTITAAPKKPFRVVKKFVKRLAPKNIVRTITRAPTRIKLWPGFAKGSVGLGPTRTDARREAEARRRAVSLAKARALVKKAPVKKVPTVKAPVKKAPPEATSTLVKAADPSPLIDSTGGSALVDDARRNDRSPYQPTSQLITGGGSSFQTAALRDDEARGEAVKGGLDMKTGMIAAAGVGGVALLMLLMRKK